VHFVEVQTPYWAQLLWTHKCWCIYIWTFFWQPRWRVNLYADRLVRAYIRYIPIYIPKLVA